MANQFGLARFRALTSGGALCVALCCLGPGQSGRASAGTVHHRPQRQGGVYAATFTTIDAPGACTGPNQGTYAFSINTAGAITGYYIDTISVFHSFVRSPSGTLTTFDAPGAGTGAYQGTSAHGINAAGAITGYYINRRGSYYGFVRSPSGAVARFDAPGAGTGFGYGTTPWTINDAGVVDGPWGS